MELRSSLLPPRIPFAAIPELAALVEEIDLLPEGEAAPQIVRFNDLAGSNLSHQDFREYFATQSAEDFAVEQVVLNAVVPTPDLTEVELVELVRRALSAESAVDTAAYHALLRVNGAEKAIGWIYWPPDWNAETTRWGDDRPISEYAPSAEQIVAWLFEDQTTALE